MANFNENVKAKLEELRLALQGHGGDLELVAINGKQVLVKLRGACGSCPHATATLQNLIQQTLQDEIDPEIVVEQVL